MERQTDKLLGRQEDELKNRQTERQMDEQARDKQVVSFNTSRNHLFTM